MTIQAALFRSCALALAIAGLAVAAHPQSDNAPRRAPTVDSTAVGSISGRVTLPSGDPVNNRVRITLSTLNDPGMTGFTDNNGSFTFSNLRAGNYSIEVVGDHKLFEPTTEQVFLPRGASITVNITLREKNAATENKAIGIVSAAETDEKIPEAARKEYDKATGLASDGRVSEAVESFKKALAIFPAYLRAHNDLGAQYLKLKRLDEAAAQFEAALDINPKVFNPRLNLGIARLEQKNYSDALEHLNQAVALDSSSAAAHLYLGVVLEETDELEAAERELRSALSLGGPAMAVGHFYLAQLQMKKGDKDQAVSELTIFLKESPNNELAPRARRILDTLKQQ
ncbi:MAG TPA: tetratricopeptide repeat protein [Blastocatellia bacterium]|nr:tetratricopeptide repeat protein [Blastocatellia bacterium]